MTQIKQIEKYLETHKKGLTSLEAFEMFGATRLASIIHTLKSRGAVINTETVNVKTRYGRNVSVARYRLVR